MYDTDGKPCPPTGAPPPPPLHSVSTLSAGRHPMIILTPMISATHLPISTALSKYYYTHMHGSHATMTIFRSVTARVARAARGEREWTIKSKWNNFTVDN